MVPFFIGLIIFTLSFHDALQIENAWRKGVYPGNLIHPWMKTSQKEPKQEQAPEPLHQ